MHESDNSLILPQEHAHTLWQVFCDPLSLYPAEDLIA